MTSPLAAITAWPVAKVGTGEALNKRAVAGRLGLKLSTVESAIRRTRLGVAAVAFPDADGYAIDPESGRSVMVPYWYERKIIAYGKATGALDRYGSIVD